MHCLFTSLFTSALFSYHPPGKPNCESGWSTESVEAAETKNYALNIATSFILAWYSITVLLQASSLPLQASSFPATSYLGQKPTANSQKLIATNLILAWYSITVLLQASGFQLQASCSPASGFKLLASSFRYDTPPSFVSASHCHLPPKGGRPRRGDSLPTACSLGQQPRANSQKPIATYLILTWYRIMSCFQLQASGFKLQASSYLGQKPTANSQ